ncbi:MULTISPECIES: helix-turn-helix transcriptional regulator [Anoxybacillaceae]|uniref:Putative Xre family DNA-binding protein n=1 Tax=Parageobacillus caldoxylosilyticus NBRC 107762 TaxID=1220594 RepID=A0A023DKN2_9BACL|nr:MULTISPECIES: helix-turn-helix transcriptional regulator [Bacillaceae]GAJ41835.1 putative Xre family DNA-binding protein [Parageobacillus caldoxylosilyticus NBRC 107762]
MVINNIRDLRRSKKWSQADLAERLDVTRQTIIAIENHKYCPSLELALKIAMVFETPVETIFHLEERRNEK